MASRVIRDTYPTSETVASMKPGAQDRLPRYWLAADDFGCFLHHAQVLRGRLFPLREDMTTKHVEDDLREFKKAGLVTVWKAKDGRTYGYFRGWWDSNRRPRPGTVRKTPPPPEGGEPPAAEPNGSAPAATALRTGSDLAPAVRSSQTQDPPVAPQKARGHSLKPLRLRKRNRGVTTLAEDVRAEQDRIRNERSKLLHEQLRRGTDMDRDAQLEWVQQRCHASPEEAADVVTIVESALGLHKNGAHA